MSWARGKIVLVVWLLSTLHAVAQFGGGGGLGGGMGGGFGGGGGGMGGGFGGVYLDADGVLRTNMKRGKAAKTKQPTLPSDVAERVDLRQVSLRKLDAALAKALAGNSDVNALPVELRRSAGLFRIDYVIVDRERKDVILCGPAEGWTEELDGRALGKNSRRPALDPVDFAVALRCVLQGDGVVKCSIDPTKEGLAEALAYKIPEITGDKRQADDIRETLSERLGLQDVMTAGVPAGSRFALALIDADYRMKRMAMGLERVAGLFTHLDVATENVKRQRPTPGYARWWFTTAYDGVAHDEAQRVFRFEGAGMKLMSEKDFVESDGGRKGSGQASETGDGFATTFNRGLAKLEEKYPPFADLHNLYDLMMTAGLIKKLGVEEWFADSTFLDERRMKIPTVKPPKRAEPVVAYKQAKGRFEGGAQKLILGVAAGGVSINPSSAFGQAGFMKSSSTGSGTGKSSTTGSGTGKSGGGSGTAGGSAAVPAVPPSIAPAVTGANWWANSGQ